MIWTTNFGRTSILEGVLVWYGGNQMIIHFFKTSEVADILFIIFFKSFWWKMASAGRNWTKFAPQTAAPTFCLLFCIYPSSILYVWHRRTNCQQSILIPAEKSSDILTNFFQWLKMTRRRFSWMTRRWYLNVPLTIFGDGLFSNHQRPYTVQ